MCLLVFLCFTTSAQNFLSGLITDTLYHPIVGAIVYIKDLNKGTVSDVDGRYQLADLPKGSLKVDYSYMGFIHQLRTVTMCGEPQQLDVQLKVSQISINEVIVSSCCEDSRRQQVLNIEVLPLNTLTLQNSPNFMEVLRQIPGMDMISKGNGIAKPVVRGLSMNDMITLYNGTRYENYQYSDHHPLGIDEYGIDHVEVIKGPASLLYGSDAIGGVLNFMSEKPASIGTIIGDYNVGLFSNSLGETQNFGLKGAFKHFFGGMRIGQYSHADYLQGGGAYAPNTRFNGWSAKANLGATGKVGVFSLKYEYSSQKIGLAEEEAMAQIIRRARKNEIYFQQFNTHLLSSQNKLFFGKCKLDLNATYQNTELTHVGEKNEYELQMRLGTLSYEAKLHITSIRKSDYYIGFQGFDQKNRNINQRETILLPNALVHNYALFGILEHVFRERWFISAGIRYDYRLMHSVVVNTPNVAPFRPAISKHYGRLNGSVGATYSYRKWTVRANAATAFRCPNLAELTSNGRHEMRFEVGDATLKPEQSCEFDVGSVYEDRYITVDAALFCNLIHDYIFLDPTDDTTAEGIRVYRYQQSNAILYGGESRITVHPYKVRWLRFETTYAMVIGKQQREKYLPYIPANKLNFSLRLTKDTLSILNNSYLSIIVGVAFRQSRVAPNEEVTPAYSLVNLQAGTTFRFGKQSVQLDIGVNNLLDIQYRDHLSTLREVGLYDSGRTFTVNIKIPFCIGKGASCMIIPQ